MLKVHLSLSFSNQLATLKSIFMLFHLKGNIFTFYVDPTPCYKTVSSTSIKYIRERKKEQKFQYFERRYSKFTTYYQWSCNEDSTQAKQKRCSFYEGCTDKKISTSCCSCSAFACHEHSVKRIFVKLVANNECHLNHFLLGSNRERAYFIKRLVPKYEKILYQNINCRYDA